MIIKCLVVAGLELDILELNQDDQALLVAGIGCGSRSPAGLHLAHTQLTTLLGHDTALL